MDDFSYEFCDGVEGEGHGKDLCSDNNSTIGIIPFIFFYKRFFVGIAHASEALEKIDCSVLAIDLSTADNSILLPLDMICALL